MILARSFWRKAMATGIAAGAFVYLYEVTILDSRDTARTTDPHESAALPMPGSRLVFGATAYCKGITTTAGVAVQNGIAAADPEVLPVGSVVQVDSLGTRYDGIYTVMDTGPNVHGRMVDLYMWSCREANEFGRQSVRLTVLRLGWNPRATTPGFVDRFLKPPAAAPQPLPSRPLPQLPSDTDLAK